MDILIAARGWRADLPEGRQGGSDPPLPLDRDPERRGTPRLILALSIAGWAAVLYIFSAALGGIVQGAPPSGMTPDPELGAWYRSLRDHRGISCCDESDCRPVEYRSRGDSIEVFVDRASFGANAPDAWVPVPPEAILQRDNPTGGGVACYYAGKVACFVRGTEG